jgi:class 3 adenylate cyclase
VSEDASPGPTIEIAYREVLQSLEEGIALVDADSWEILFENAKFFTWFPPGEDDDETLTKRVAELNADRAASRLAAGRNYSFEIPSEKDGRQEPLRATLRVFPGRESCYLVEVQNISKELETQYMLDSYSKLAERNAHELEREKERAEKLLLNIMPRAVFEEIKEYGTATPTRFESVSILMLDFVGFTDMTIANDPSAVVSELNDIFSAFDRVAEMFDCERVKTIGDAYMAVSGISGGNQNHAVSIAKTALRFRRYLERRNQAHPQQWVARIGINTGSVIGSIVGVQKYVYDLLGPGVNLAARMESLSEPMHITCNQATYEHLKDDFVFEELGETEVKGFGTQNLFSLDAERGSPHL